MARHQFRAKPNERLFCRAKTLKDFHHQLMDWLTDASLGNTLEGMRDMMKRHDRESSVTFTALAQCVATMVKRSRKLERKKLSAGTIRDWYCKLSCRSRAEGSEAPWKRHDFEPPAASPFK
jgi:hypothetical protein